MTPNPIDNHLENFPWDFAIRVVEMNLFFINDTKRIYGSVL